MDCLRCGLTLEDCSCTPKTQLEGILSGMPRRHITPWQKAAMELWLQMLWDAEDARDAAIDGLAMQVARNLVASLLRNGPLGKSTDDGL